MGFEDGLAAEVAALVYRRFRMHPSPDGVVADLELDAAERELAAPLPQSYRAFLRTFGSQAFVEHDLFGLPRNGLWGDIVLMNDLDGGVRPRHYLKFTEDGQGRSYYFDTARMGADGECPVVVRDRCGVEAECARGFLDFLAGAGAAGKAIRGA